jgi:hypothetical protein
MLTTGMRITLNVGWVEKTAGGFRIFESQRGRYFRDPVRARARETVTWKRNCRRSSAGQRREPYLAVHQHLEFALPRAIRITLQEPDGAA